VCAREERRGKNRGLGVTGEEEKEEEEEVVVGGGIGSVEVTKGARV